MIAEQNKITFESNPKFILFLAFNRVTKLNNMKNPKNGNEEKPINFVFHGGSGSSFDEIREAISYGAIKMNIDTDSQWGFTTGIRDYFLKYNDYIKEQIGNPEGDNLPNKKYYDPRKYLREGEITFKNRLLKAFKDLNNINKNK